MYRKRKISILVALSMAALFYMTGCTGKNAGSAGSSVKKDVFRVGMECDYPPFNWTQLNMPGDMMWRLQNGLQKVWAGNW